MGETAERTTAPSSPGSRPRARRGSWSTRSRGSARRRVSRPSGRGSRTTPSSTRAVASSASSGRGPSSPAGAAAGLRGAPRRPRADPRL